VDAARYSPDGREILTASDDKTARIWDAATGMPLAVLLGHRDALQSAAYAPDGKHLVTASLDKTARIWDARIPADLNRQILWDAAAQTDRLTQADRGSLELPADARVRVWRSPASACDQAAAAVYDPLRTAPGITRESIVAAVAVAACGAELAAPRHDARADYQMGRALAKKGDAKGARDEFERALDGGYSAAAVDLADLLAAAGAPPEDLERARALYERAWRDRVPIAAFRLGTLYEAGATKDDARAWEWYRRGADAGEPYALARQAERDETRALGATDEAHKNTLLLAALSGYAAAADHAFREDWPDDAWRHWRFRRATLARILARSGLMSAAADAFAAAVGPTP
jgi:TPR repeat protein